MPEETHLPETCVTLLLSFPPSAPCSPSIQNSTLICGTNSSSLSWTPMADATGYVVNATATSGHAVSCSSATATCTLTDLLCSETYTATISAKGSQCDSPPSSSTNISTCECVSLRVWRKNFLLFHCEKPTSMSCFLFSPLSPSYHIKTIYMWLQHGSAQVD